MRRPHPTPTPMRAGRPALCAGLLLALLPAALAQDGAPAGRLAQRGEISVSWRQLNPGNTGIVGDYSHVLHVDRNDVPWIPTYNPIKEHGGMSSFASGTWTPVSNVDHPVIASPRFNDIAEDANGILWIATDLGLLAYDPAVGPASLVRYDTSNTSMPTDELMAVEVDPTGVLWLGAHSFSAPFGGLYRFDPTTNDLDVWTTANGLPWYQQWPGWDWIDFVAITPEPAGDFTVWFGSWEMGVGTYREGVFRSFEVDPPPPGTPKPVQLRSNRAADEQGFLWMWSDQGLARRNPDGSYLVLGGPPTGSFDRVDATHNGRAIVVDQGSVISRWAGGWEVLGPWGGDFTNGLGETSDGTVWVSGRGGSARWQNGAWQRFRLTNTGPLGYFLRDVELGPNGSVYMNGNAAPGVGGFQYFDGEDWTCINTYNYGLFPEWTINSDEVNALCVRSNGKVAFAPSGWFGVHEWDGTSYTQILAQASIDLLAEDGLGRLWAVEERGGAYVIDVDGSSTYLPYDSGLIPFSTKGAVIPDPAAPGWVWIPGWDHLAHTNGTDSVMYTPEQIGLREGTVDYQLAHAALDEDGTLWLASLGLGLVHWDPATMSYVRHDMTSSALPSDWVRLVEIAPDDSIWCSTFDWKYPYPGGVSRFDGRSWRTWTMFDSPLVEDQHTDLESRAVPGGYEVWVATSSEGISILEVKERTPPRSAGTRRL